MLGIIQYTIPQLMPIKAQCTPVLDYSFRSGIAVEVKFQFVQEEASLASADINQFCAKNHSVPLLQNA